MKIKVNRNIADIIKSTIDKVKDQNNPYKLAALINTRAMSNHRYKNRTWTLTRSHKFEVTENRNDWKIEFSTIYYGEYVITNTKQNWVKNAANFYKRKLKLW